VTEKVTDVTTLEDQFLSAQRRLSDTIVNGERALFGDFRQEGLRRFSESGFPANKTEAWKYTPVRKWLKDDFLFEQNTSTLASIPASEFRGDVQGNHVVCVDGLFSEALSSLPSDVSFEGYIGRLSGSPIPADQLLSHLELVNPGTETPFDALNQSFFRDGLLIHIPAQSKIEEPIYVTNLLTGGASQFIQPRTLIIAEAGSECTIVDLRDQRSGHALFENSVTQVHVGGQTHLDYYHIYDRGPSSRLVRKLNVYQEADSTFATNEFILSGALVRSDLNFLPDGTGCDTHLNGFYLAQNDMHIDVHTMVDHAQPHCVSNELFKGIIADESTAVFNGRVLVRQDAQQINAYQSNRNIVLSESAKMFSKPELEIYADDVKCSHGATTGQIDDEALFYLRSRGIRETAARNLLLRAFASDVIDLVKVDDLRSRLESTIAERLMKQSN
jgi:Fe-S cluster assembly protein SufD